MLSSVVFLQAQTRVPPPRQDLGLPYTRSAQEAALAKIRDGVALFPGSRYGYIRGLRVRLDGRDLLRSEAVETAGKLFVPVCFASLIGRDDVKAPAVPADLQGIADRWVYAPEELGGIPDFSAPPGILTREINGRTWVSVVDMAHASGLQSTRHASGLLYLGKKPLEFGVDGQVLLEGVITLFDTPEKFADPDIATRSIPNLTRQGKWTDHVKVTPEQLAILNGPETAWRSAAKEDYDLHGFNQKLLGSKVPPPGVYPRLLFNAEDVPMLAARVKSTTVGRMSLDEMEHLFRKSFWDPKTSDGEVFQKLASGDLVGLEWEVPDGNPAFTAGHQFKGQKQGVFNSHVAYVPECLTSMALY